MVKRLYVMADTHDDLEAVARAVDFAKAQGLANSRLVHVGDLALRPYTMQDLTSVMKTGDAKSFVRAIQTRTRDVHQEYKQIFDESGMPYTVIPGNYDSSLTQSFGEADIHNRAVDWDGIKVVGYGAGGNLDEEWIGPRHMHPVVQLGQIQLFNPLELKTLLENNRPSIAVIHNPPYGFCDDMHDGQHVGTPTTMKYMQKNDGLKLVLSGHIHEAGPNANNPNNVKGIAAGRRSSGEVTFVINPGNLGRFELIDPNTLETGKWKDGTFQQFDYGTFVRVDIEDDGTPVSVTQYTVKEDGRKVGKVEEMASFDLKI